MHLYGMIIQDQMNGSVHPKIGFENYNLVMRGILCDLYRLFTSSMMFIFEIQAPSLPSC